MTQHGTHSGQAELPYMVEAKERERLLQAVEFPDKRNRTLLAALLMCVASYPPGKCFVSQETFARKFKVCPKTIQRAFLQLQEMNLVAFDRVNRNVAGRSVTLNTYAVHWPGVKESITKQSAVQVPEDTQPQPSNAKPTDRTVTRGRSDIYEGAIGQLGPTDRTSGCLATKDLKGQITTTALDENHGVVVGVLNDFDQSWTQTETDRICEGLKSCEVQFAIESAVESFKRRGHSVADADRYIAHFKKFRDLKQFEPSYLRNWFAKAGSAPRELICSREVKPTSQPSSGRADGMSREQRNANSDLTTVTKALHRKFFAERGSGATDAEVNDAMSIVALLHEQCMREHGCRASHDEILQAIAKAFPCPAPIGEQA